MPREFNQIQWDEALEDDCRQIIRLAVREDLDRFHDLTTVALVSGEATGRATVTAREDGVLAGMPAAELALNEMNAQVAWSAAAVDGDRISAAQRIATIQGSTRDILTCERIVLNLLGRLCGIATLTDQFVRAIQQSSAHVYDTRKTTPGWRRLEKYAVRCGGGRNHRTGLFDAVLIKDNHLASGIAPADAVRQARDFVQNASEDAEAIVEIEVDSLQQLREVLPAGPNIVLLDNMTPGQLKEAVAIRNEMNSAVQLEASGGVNLDTAAGIAASGVERISVGALTHSAIALDVGLDWQA